MSTSVTESLICESLLEITVMLISSVLPTLLVWGTLTCNKKEVAVHAGKVIVGGYVTDQLGSETVVNKNTSATLPLFVIMWEKLSCPPGITLPVCVGDRSTPRS